MFDDGNDTTFDISMPSNLCPYAVIGDLESPQGDIMESATLSKIHDTLFALSSSDQTTYLLRLLNNAIDAIQAEFNTLVCDEPVGGSRALLWSLDPRQLKKLVCLDHGYTSHIWHNLRVSRVVKRVGTLSCTLWMGRQG